MSYKFGATSRKDRIAARFLGQVHAMLSRAALQVREEQGLTQAQVARELGVDRATISRLLSGAGNPTVRTIGELAGALGYRPELVLHKVEPRPGANHEKLIVRKNEVVTEQHQTAVCQKPVAYVYDKAERSAATTAEAR